MSAKCRHIGSIYLSAGQSFRFILRQVSCGANSVKQEKGTMTEQYIAGTIGILGAGWLGLPLAEEQ